MKSFSEGVKPRAVEMSFGRKRRTIIPQTMAKLPNTYTN